MLARGFLGTRADLLLDIIVVLVALTLPILLASFLLAKKGSYGWHRRVQVDLSALLAVALVLFEVDIRLSGGIAQLSQGTRFAGSALLNGALGVHLVFAITSTVLWTWLLAASVKGFARPPAPGRFSARHRFWGRLAMLDLAATSVTGVMLYGLAFAPK